MSSNQGEWRWQLILLGKDKRQRKRWECHVNENLNLPIECIVMHELKTERKKYIILMCAAAALSSFSFIQSLVKSTRPHAHFHVEPLPEIKSFSWRKSTTCWFYTRQKSAHSIRTNESKHSYLKKLYSK